MARIFRRNPRLTALAEPNVTPLIDLAFSLLIIFMITTPLLEQTIPIELPREEEREDDGVERDIRYQTVGVEGPGMYFFGEERVGADAMRQRLESLVASEEDVVLNVRAARTVDYQDVVDLLNLIMGSGLSKISLDTQVEVSP